MTSDQKREFCLMISIGCDRETACKYVGWASHELRDELIQDSDFAKQLARAEATSEFGHMRNVHNATKDKKNWRASVWWLERCAPERYARRQPGAVAAVDLRRIIQQLTDVLMAEGTSSQDRQRLVQQLTQLSQEVQDKPAQPEGDRTPERNRSTRRTK